MILDRGGRLVDGGHFLDLGCDRARRIRENVGSRLTCSERPYDDGMLLAGRKGDQFELNLLGYEFPRIEDDEWDSNWLQIRISATNERGSWTATDSSLVTREVMLLADWLQAIADHDEVATELEFTEPNLSFELVEVTDRVRLRAWFELELRPRWARSYEVPARDLCVDLDLAKADLLAAAESLRAQLRRFPPRAGRD